MITKLHTIMKYSRHPIKLLPYFNKFSRSEYIHLMEDYSKNSKRWINPLDHHSGKTIFRTGLKVSNSLCNEKVEFVTKSGDRNLTWYMCGPTVYDHSHLGHARTYVSFDILRRIMQSYFGYNVDLCMNITDIDDKIIKNSHEAKIEFSEFAKKWEDDYFKDMRALNVLYPNHITRVSEYVPEIIKFIERLIEKKYAYEKNGSVYFDIVEFSNNNHMYAKLVPQHSNTEKENINSLIEAEGELSKDILKDKKNIGDFALWKKKIKDYEPSWDSPWGQGRPGWHIECSVMCTEIFGDSLDIHSGGCDLKFPHHDNEIAQTEGYYDNQQWINYFLHTGHLNIEGLKMSKSLKNFRKISEFIDMYNANTFRLYFANTKWDATMDFTEDGLYQSHIIEKYFAEFFQNVKVWLRENDLKRDLKMDELDKNLLQVLTQKQKAIDEAFCDNFNTPAAIGHVRELLSRTYEYVNLTNNKSLKVHLIYSVTKFVAHILKSIGFTYNTEFIDYFNFSSDNNLNSEQILTPYIDALSKFRDQIKTAAAIDKDPIKILKICDELRDEILPYLGIQIEDKGKGVPSIWKLHDKDHYIQELNKKKEIALQAKLEKEKQAKEKELKLSTSAKEYYAMQKKKYSEFDSDGVPTHDVKGYELSKEIRDNLKKEFKKHDKNHLKWLENKK